MIKRITRLIILISIISMAMSCQKDDLIWVESSFPEGVDVKMLESWSYEVPLDIKSNGEWTTETTGDWFYISPESGKGNATVNICVLDNNTERRQQGSIRIITKDGKSSNIEIQQKSISDYDENLSMKDKGYAKYAVGYGYDATKGEYPSPKCLTQQIVKFKDLWDKDEVGFDPSVSVYSERTITGSSFEELSNKLNVSASLTGDYGGFSGEVSASFNMNNYSSGNHEFAMNYIDYEVGTISTSLSSDELKSYLTPSAKKAINGEGKYSDAKELIKEFGTHLVVKANVGGKLRLNMAVDITKVTGSYDLHTFAKASYADFGISTDGSVTNDLKKSFNNNKTNCEFSFTAFGGNSKSLTISSDKKAIEDWKNSLDYDNYNLALIGIENSYLVPIQKLITLEKGVSQRVAAIEVAIADLSKAEHPSSYDSGTEVKVTIPDFSGVGATTTLVKEVKTKGEVKAWICNEYIPAINKDGRVTVIYPVIHNKPRFNLGYFIGNESHKPARVSWSGNNVYIKGFDQVPFGTNSTVYIKGASVSSTQYTDKVFNGDLNSVYLTADREGSSHNYPLVKIFGNIWTREDYKSCSDGGGTELKHQEPEVYQNKMAVKSSTAVIQSWNRCYYRLSCVDKANFAPNGWRVPTAKDYENIAEILTKSNISQIGQVFRGKTAHLGYEAPTDALGGWYGTLKLLKEVYIVELRGEGIQNEYITKDGSHIRMNDQGFAVEPIDDFQYMTVRLIMVQ